MQLDRTALAGALRMHWGGFIGFGGIAAVTAVAVSGPEVHRFAIPETVARERLASTPLPQVLLGMVGNQVALVREEGALVWNIGGPGSRSVGRVTLDGQGAATDVTISFDLADNALGDSPMGRTRLTRSMAEGMFREHVEAVLGNRPFDPQRSMLGTAQEMQADPEVMREFGEALGDQFNEVATMMNENAEFSAFPPPPPAGGRAAVQPDPDSYRPTTDL